MFRRTWSMLGVSLLVTSFVAAIGATAVPEKDATLEEEVRALRKQVEQLERRLKALEAAPPQISLPPGLSYSPLTLPAPDPSHRRYELTPPSLPPGTEQREFNGAPYYVMPISGVTEKHAAGIAITTRSDKR